MDVHFINENEGWAVGNFGTISYLRYNVYTDYCFDDEDMEGKSSTFRQTDRNSETPTAVCLKNSAEPYTIICTNKWGEEINILFDTITPGEYTIYGQTPDTGRGMSFRLDDDEPMYYSTNLTLEICPESTDDLLVGEFNATLMPYPNRECQIDIAGDFSVFLNVDEN